MSSSLRVNTIVPSTGTNVAIGTANGTVTFTDSVNFVLGTGSSIFSPASNTLTFGTNDAERLRITSAGSVGIGTDTPGTTKLKIETGSGTRAISLNAPTNGTYITFETAGTAYADIGAEKGVVGSGSADTPVINARGSRDISFRTNSSERLRITSAGNLGIGDASPTKPLTVGTTTPVILLDDQSSRTLEIRGPSTTHNATVLTTSTHDLLLGTNNAERFRITSAGRIGINQTSPEAMLQVDYDYANSEVGLRLRAASGSGTKTWQLSEINGNAGVFTIRNATNSQNNLSIDGSSGYVGVNATNPDRRLEVVETASSLTYPVAVSNFTNASTGVGAAIDFRLTTGGNTRGELGLVYAGNSNSDGTDFVFKPNDGSTGNIERLRIKGSNGNMGLGVDPVYSGVFGGSQRVLHIGGTTAPGLRIQSSTSNQGDFIIQAGNSGGATYLSNLSNNADTSFYNTSGGSTTEKVRIYHGGQVTKPNQPAFNCKLSTATGANFTGFLVFNSVSYNIGNHYNSSNGRFTVPVDGRYLFTWYTNVEKGGSAGVIWGDWYVNGNARGNRFYTRWDGNWELIGGTIILDLDTNDYVQVYAATSGNWDGGSYGSYSGYLLG